MSSSKSRIKNLQQMIPPTISIDSFLNERQLEIKVMQKSLNNTTESIGNKRVFQTIPRYMRRRAASHNIKRLPKKLQKSALNQMLNDPIPNKKTTALGKSRYSKRSRKSLASRQHSNQSKLLSTHLWHSKRFKMILKYNYKLPLHSNIKSFRPIHKMSQNGCIINDVSYFAHYKISGNFTKIIEIFNGLLDPIGTMINSKRWIDGNRRGIVSIYEKFMYPLGYIGEMEFIWVQSPINESTTDPTIRTLMISIHPSISDLVLSQIQKSINMQSISGIEILLFKEISRFELSGPKSHLILKTALRAIKNTTENSASLKIWTELTSIYSTSEMSPNLILGLIIDDPRLFFPKKNLLELNFDSNEKSNDCLINWPKNVSFSQIYTITSPNDPNFMNIKRCSTFEINNRKSESLIPGTPLESLPTDAKIPILLIQRPDSCHNTGWDIIVPSIWATDIWRNLTFAGARASGLRDRHSMHYESKLPFFPNDYPESDIFITESLLKQSQLLKKYNDTPKSKRINYQKSFKIQDPFITRFDKLNKQCNDSKDQPKVITVIKSVKIIDLLKQDIVEFNDIKDRFPILKDQYPMFNSLIWNSAFVRVSVEMMFRGVPDDNSRIYSATLDEYSFWIKHQQQNSIAVIDMDLENDISHPKLDVYPEEDRLIGFVTTGRISLKRGFGMGIATVFLKALLEIKSTSLAENRKHLMFVLIRTTKSRVCRPALCEYI